MKILIIKLILLQIKNYKITYLNNLKQIKVIILINGHFF